MFFFGYVEFEMFVGYRSVKIYKRDLGQERNLGVGGIINVSDVSRGSR